MKRPVFCIVVILILALLYFAACKNAGNVRNIKDYYFQMEELKTAKVYEYGAVENDSLASQYWYYQSLDMDTAFYFTGQLYHDSYRDSFTVLQFFREEVVSNGILMKEYFLFPADSSGQQIRQTTEIIYPNVFPFEVRDSAGVFLYKMQWQDILYPGRTTTLIRNRRYVGDTQYEYKGRQYHCVTFAVKELMEIEEEGFQEIQYSGTEVYAEGLGLVYFRKEISEGFVLEYELKDIYPMEHLEQKFGSQLQQ